jgi:hypothetical protein
LEGHFIYNSIGAVELFAGDKYELVGVTNTSDYYSFYGMVSGYTLNAPITITGYTHNAATAPLYNATANWSSQGFGPDMGFETPEPSSLLLLGSGLAGLAGLLKRKLSA